jgi:hypothetical protein
MEGNKLFHIHFNGFSFFDYSFYFRMNRTFFPFFFLYFVFLDHWQEQKQFSFPTLAMPMGRGNMLLNVSAFCSCSFVSMWMRMKDAFLIIFMCHKALSLEHERLMDLLQWPSMGGMR